VEVADESFVSVEDEPLLQALRPLIVVASIKTSLVFFFINFCFK
jgi:hypothetical protein